jgi:hypothetical protein
LPSYFGVWFALQAARLGSSRATIPMMANAFVVAVIWALSLIAILAVLSAGQSNPAGTRTRTR